MGGRQREGTPSAKQMPNDRGHPLPRGRQAEGLTTGDTLHLVGGRQREGTPSAKQRPNDRGHQRDTIQSPSHFTSFCCLSAVLCVRNC